jgi:predicted aminopeptidase
MARSFARRLPWLAGLGLLVTATLLATSGCSTLGYYAQAAQGHLELLNRARPVADLLTDPSTPEPLRARLQLAERMRNFAVSDLHLPDNSSYRRYADLQRSAVVFNVVATPELSLALHTWCFPVVGCVGYRGYYAQAPADALAAELRAQNLEVDVYGVPAYSTLGYSNWVGGDPLLNTFLNWPDAELARLIFHELAHQVAYASDDTAFNESFATAVERLGGQRWLQAHAVGGTSSTEAQTKLADARRLAFRQFALAWRDRLQALYTSALPVETKRAQKQQLMAQMRADYAQLKTEQWGGYSGYDAWVARANNASFAVLGAYNTGVPAFERLFEANGRDFKRFYAAVQGLAALPKAQRQAKLAALDSSLSP